jgi:hypothetical protein
MKNKQAAFLELEKAEAEVLNLMKLAEGTVDELKRLPECSEETLTNLSQNYLANIKAVQEALKENASVLDQTAEEAQGSNSFQLDYLEDLEKAQREDI